MTFERTDDIDDPGDVPPDWATICFLLALMVLGFATMLL